MIENYITIIATSMGIQPVQIKVIDGLTFGSLDVHLVQVAAGGEPVSMLVHQPEMMSVIAGLPCCTLEQRVRTNLANLI